MKKKFEKISIFFSLEARAYSRILKMGGVRGPEKKQASENFSMRSVIVSVGGAST